jgi:2-succinyl-6-hydroxy-2,4-cyclohexadiene-1-carboxylate synthase
MMVHGFTGSSEAWGEKLLAALAAKHRVVAPDLPGHGASDPSHDPDRYRLGPILSDLAAVQRALIAGPCAWIGYSMGGRVALAAAVQAVAPMSALVLESASPGLAGAEARRARLDVDETWARQLASGDLDAFVERWMAQPLFRTQRSLGSEVLRREAKRRRRQDPLALAACLRGLGTAVQPPMWQGLSSVRTRTLLLTGSSDEKFEKLAAQMSHELPMSQHRSIPEAGHAVHLERPRAWLDAVTTFLAEPLVAHL